MLTAKDIEQCVFWACETEVSSPKPGNVNCFSNNHEMDVADFIKSAHAIAPIMARSDLSVGELILQSIRATRAVVDCNTNLGIVLLFAPLCKAMHQCQTFGALPKTLENILENLTIDDAEKCYQAIRLADAGGMGKVDDQDINEQPTITLRQAMAMAKSHDTIAKQYTNNYDAIWCIGLPNLTNAINCGETVEWATAFAYLSLLSEIPDTLICRKKGLKVSEKVSAKALFLIENIKENSSLSKKTLEVLNWDNELKKEKLNPGTTADLSAVTLLAYAFRQKSSLTEF